MENSARNWVPSSSYVAMQGVHVGERQTVPELAGGTGLKEDEDLTPLDHCVAHAPQEVRLADSRPPLDDEVADWSAVSHPFDRL